MCLVGADELSLAIFRQRHECLHVRARSLRHRLRRMSRILFTRTRSTCYTRTTTGAKGPALARSETATSSLVGSSNLTHFVPEEARTRRLSPIRANGGTVGSPPGAVFGERHRRHSGQHAAKRHEGLLRQAQPRGPIFDGGE